MLAKSFVMLLRYGKEALLSRTFCNFLLVEIPSRAVRTNQHAEGPSGAAVASFDSGNIRARSRHRNLGEGEKLLRTVESVEAILGADTVGNSADVNRVDHFVLHGHTMGQDRTFVQNFLQLSLLRGDRFLHLGYRFRCGLAKREVVGTI